MTGTEVLLQWSRRAKRGNTACARACGSRLPSAAWGGRCRRHGCGQPGHSRGSALDACRGRASAGPVGLTSCTAGPAGHARHCRIRSLPLLGLRSPQYHGEKGTGNNDSGTPDMPESREVDAAADSGETCEERPDAQGPDGCSTETGLSAVSAGWTAGRSGPALVRFRRRRAIRSGAGLGRLPLDDASRRGTEIGNGRGKIGNHGLAIRTVVPKTAPISTACRHRQEKPRHFRMGIDHLAEKRTQ